MGPGRTIANLDDEIVVTTAASARQQDICARDSIWNTPMFGTTDHVVNLRSRG